jgi:hypothetical protein
VIADVARVHHIGVFVRHGGSVQRII